MGEGGDCRMFAKKKKADAVAKTRSSVLKRLKASPSVHGSLAQLSNVNPSPALSL